MTLIDRLSKLEGPNRRLDHEIHILFFVADDKKDTVEWNHFGSYSWSPSPDHVMIDKVPAYTASVDAAIALAEKAFPGCCWTISNNKRYEKPYSEIILTDAHGRSGYCGLGTTTAIALCIAILRAKEANHGE